MNIDKGCILQIEENIAAIGLGAHELNESLIHRKVNDNYHKYKYTFEDID